MYLSSSLLLSTFTFIGANRSTIHIWMESYFYFSLNCGYFFLPMMHSLILLLRFISLGNIFGVLHNLVYHLSEIDLVQYFECNRPFPLFRRHNTSAKNSIYIWKNSNFHQNNNMILSCCFCFCLWNSVHCSEAIAMSSILKNCTQRNNEWKNLAKICAQSFCIVIGKNIKCLSNVYIHTDLFALELEIVHRIRMLDSSSAPSIVCKHHLEC